MKFLLVADGMTGADDQPSINRLGALKTSIRWWPGADDYMIISQWEE